MKLSGSRVVVIGGAGFIGSHLVEELLHEDVAEVVVYDNFSRGRRENLAAAVGDPRLRLLEGDILYSDVLDAVVSGADHVFHLAALWLLHCHEYPRAAFQVNVQGTFNVLEACVKHQVKRLVFSSSASVYGDPDIVPTPESHGLNNRTFYGATKIAGEQMCRAFHARYGLNYVSLRYMNVFGPRQEIGTPHTSVVMKMLGRIESGLPPVIYGDGSQTYDFIYVGDVARANVYAMKADSTDKAYNIGTGEGTTVRSLAQMILEQTRTDLQIQYEPSAQSFVSRRIGSTDAARHDLGFAATTALRAGLERTIAWRHQQGGVGS